MDTDNNENGGCCCFLLVTLGAMTLTGMTVSLIYWLMESLIIAVAVIGAGILLLILLVNYLFVLKVLLVVALVIAIVQIVKILMKNQII